MDTFTENLLFGRSKSLSFSAFLESIFAAVYRKTAFLLQGDVQFSTLIFQVPSLCKVPFYFSSNIMDTIGASMPIHKDFLVQARKGCCFFSLSVANYSIKSLLHTNSFVLFVCYYTNFAYRSSL